ncbi:MAG: BACON domain-containing protein [Bacteroidaceae bacterium]|nr:BACON domain-containing protein [Bacteroidaceae bacterium]
MKKIFSILLLTFAMVLTVSADGLNSEQMSLRQDIFNYLRTNGYNPSIDEDGDIKFVYDDRKHFISIYANDTDPMYLTLSLGFNYGETFTKEAISQYINEIGFYKAIKLVPFTNHYSFIAEMYLTNAKNFNSTFTKLLDQIKSAASELVELVEGSSSDSSNSGSNYLTVNQQSAISRTYDADAGSEVFQVSTNASEWATWGIPTWCTVVDRTATSFRLKYEANTSGITRNDYMKIKAGGQEVRIDIRQEATSSNTVSATIQDITVKHNVTTNGAKGMEILVDFNVRNMLNRTGTCNAYFYTSDGNYALQDGNNKYKTQSGKVCSTKEFKPPYKSTDYTDLVIFIPYSELHMGSGTHSLKCFISIFDDKGTEIVQSDWIDFTYTY